MTVIKKIEKSYTNHKGFKHPFWEWMESGDFTFQQLKRFALCYYGHVKVFRTYLAGALTIADNENLEVALAEIIGDEYGISEDSSISDKLSHPEQFRRFMKSLGIKEEEWKNVETIEGIKHFKNVHFDMFHSGLREEMIGAIIFGLENTTPYRHKKVATGLEKFSKRHGIKIDASFFLEHVDLDPVHSNSLLAAIESWLQDSMKVKKIISGMTKSFDAREVFLDDLSNIVMN